jgi:hypothetical protein
MRKFTARRPVLIDLKAQFDADAAHLKASQATAKSLQRWPVK